jgi:hypothetical protein
MKDKSKADNDTFELIDNLDESIHNALVEMGWIFPQTVEDIHRAQEALKGVRCRPLPPELANPSRLIRRLEELDTADSNAPLNGILAAAKERGLSSKQLAAVTKLSVVLVSMFDRGMISTVNLPKVIVRRIAEAIGSTVEHVLEYLQTGPRLAIDADFKADDAPELEDPQPFFEAVRDDPTLSPIEREYLLSRKDDNE